MKNTRAQKKSPQVALFDLWEFALADVWGDVTMIEGLGTPDNITKIHQVWVDHQVAQCGYCQSGHVMNAAALLAQTPTATEQDVDDAIQGNLCRCGTYPRIHAAITDAALRLQEA